MKTVLATIYTLMLSGAAYGQNVMQIEYFLDTDAGFGKNKLVSVTPSADGPFSFTVDVSGATVGFHALYIRTRDSNNQWSHTARRTVEVLKNPGAASNVARVEYFFDTDPGVGKAASVMLANPQPNGTFTFVIPKDKTTPGTHTMYVRAQDSPDRNWSQTQWKAVTVVNCTPPEQPTAIASQTVCAGNTVIYTTPAVAQATGYRWTVPSGWTIVSGQGASTVTLRAPAVTSVTTFSALSIAAYNVCDTGQVRTFSATVNALPARPAISTRGDTVLVSSVASGNLWFLNGTLISGATGQLYRPLAAGQYTVQVTQNGCVSPLSEPYNRIVTAVDDPMLPDIRTFPNPFTDRITVVNQSSQPVRVLLYSMTGQLLTTTEIATGIHQMNTSQWASGLYILQLIQQSNVMKRLLVK